MSKEVEVKPAGGIEDGVTIMGMLVNLQHPTLTLVAGTEPLATVRLAPTGVILHARAHESAAGTNSGQLKHQ